MTPMSACCVLVYGICDLHWRSEKNLCVFPRVCNQQTKWMWWWSGFLSDRILISILKAWSCHHSQKSKASRGTQARMLFSVLIWSRASGENIETGPSEFFPDSYHCEFFPDLYHISSSISCQKCTLLHVTELTQCCSLYIHTAPSACALCQDKQDDGGDDIPAQNTHVVLHWG